MLFILTPGLRYLLSGFAVDGSELENIRCAIVSVCEMMTIGEGMNKIHAHLLAKWHDPFVHEHFYRR